MPAEAGATANAVTWLRKNKDRLLHIIHNFATPENEVAPAAVATLMGVIHAHPPPRPLEYGSAPAMGIALARECRAPRPRCDFASFLGALRRVQRIFGRKADREQEQMKDIMVSASAHARAPSASARSGVLLVRHSASNSELARARLCVK
jgi:hypothetical protein